MFSAKIPRLMGRGQVVRRLILAQEIVGSNPTAPAMSLKFTFCGRHTHCLNDGFERRAKRKVRWSEFTHRRSRFEHEQAKKALAAILPPQPNHLDRRTLVFFI